MTQLQEEFEERLVGKKFELINGSELLVTGIMSSFNGNKITKESLLFSGTLFTDKEQEIVSIGIKDFFTQVIANNKIDYFLDKYPEYFI